MAFDVCQVISKRVSSQDADGDEFEESASHTGGRTATSVN